MKLLLNLVLLFNLFSLFSACTQNGNISPDKALQDYVEQRFKGDQSKASVLQKVTGPLYMQIENMSDSEFKNFSSVVNIKKKEFKILSSRCKNQQCYITYYLSYYNVDNNNKTEVLTDVKKVAEIINEDGSWKIKDIVNIKTYHKSLDELHITN